MQPRKILLIALLTAAVSLVPRQARADSSSSRIGLVDLRVALSNLQEVIDAQREVAETQKQLDALAKSHHDELSPADPKKLLNLSTEELDSKRLQYDFQEQTLKLKMIRIQCRTMATGYQHLQSAITSLAKARQLDLVLAGSNPPVQVNTPDLAAADFVTGGRNSQRIVNAFFSHDFLYTDVDLTPDVIAAVNKNYKSTAPPAAPLPTTKMQIGGKSFQLEIAADDASRERGMMERADFPADHGMIFVFPDVGYRIFWMHHTRFPLDVVFVDEHSRVVTINPMKAYDETGVPSTLPAKYAIELPAGAGALIKVGDTLTIPHEADAALKK